MSLNSWPLIRWTSPAHTQVLSHGLRPNIINGLISYFPIKTDGWQDWIGFQLIVFIKISNFKISGHEGNEEAFKEIAEWREEREMFHLLPFWGRGFHNIQAYINSCGQPLPFLVDLGWLLQLPTTRATLAIWGVALCVEVCHAFLLFTERHIDVQHSVYYGVPTVNVLREMESFMFLERWGQCYPYLWCERKNKLYFIHC